MTYYPTNATGWNLLLDGQPIMAALTLYNAALWNYTIFLLFVVYQIMLYLKTRNLTICFITGIIFASLFLTALSGIPGMMGSIQLMFVLLVFELGGILYLLIFK